MLFMPKKLSCIMATQLFSLKPEFSGLDALRGRGRMLQVKPLPVRPPLNFAALFTSMNKVGFS